MPKPNKGFTLIELSLFMGMFSIILVVLLQVFSLIIDKQVEVESSSAVESDRLFILTRLAYDIQRADSIITPGNPGEEGSTLALSIDGSTYTYMLDGGNLTLTSPAGTDTLNSHVRSTVSGVTFQRLGNTTGKNTINVAYTVTSVIETPQGNETKSVNTTLGTR